jgi:hypothetical protein
MFRKFILGLFFSFVSLSVCAGEYDGVWLFDGEADYYTVYQNGNQVLFVQLNEGLDSWDATMGAMVGNVAEMKTLMTKSDKIVEYTLTFTSPTTATQTIVSCSGSACGDEPGKIFTMKKIF